MAPIRDYSSWNQRTSESLEQIEPYKKYFFICEGSNTEVYYFKKLIGLRKELNIRPEIGLCLLERTEEDRSNSHPLRLLQYAKEQKENRTRGFDQDRDKMIVVFDADIYRQKPQEYREILEKANSAGDILAVTNPAFELFLLLHYGNSLETDILPHEAEILENKKIGNTRYICNLFQSKSGMNSKTNKGIGELAKYVDIAIEQEKRINQDVSHIQGKLTSNIGQLISRIREDGISPASS